MKYEWEGEGSEAGIKCKNLVLSAHAYSRLWVFSNMFLKEVSLPLKADISIHANGLPTLKCLWHPRVTMTRSAQRTWYSCTSWLNSSQWVLREGRQLQIPFQCRLHCWWFWQHVLWEGDWSIWSRGDMQSRSVAICHEWWFVAETVAGHEPALLEPKCGKERAHKKDAFNFNSGKCNPLLRKTGVGGIAPFESPVSFVLDTWHSFNGI